MGGPGSQGPTPPPPPRSYLWMFIAPLGPSLPQLAEVHWILPTNALEPTATEEGKNKKSFYRNWNPRNSVSRDGISITS